MVTKRVVQLSYVEIMKVGDAIKNMREVLESGQKTKEQFAEMVRKDTKISVGETRLDRIIKDMGIKPQWAVNNERKGFLQRVVFPLHRKIARLTQVVTVLCEKAGIDPAGVPELAECLSVPDIEEGST